jgi:hypothetical protein
VGLASSEEVRLAMDCSVLEKEPLGKDLMLNLHSKGHPACLPPAQGTPVLARKSLPHLKLRAWRNLLVRLVGRVVESLLGRSFGFGLGLIPNLSSKGFRQGRVLAKPKSEKWIEITGQGLPLDLEAGFEFSVGFGSTLGLQRPRVTTTVDLGGGLSTPTSSEFSYPLEGTGSYLMAIDFSVSEGFTNLSRPVSSDPESASASLGVLLSAISSPR